MVYDFIFLSVYWITFDYQLLIPLAYWLITKSVAIYDTNRKFQNLYNINRVQKSC